MKRGIGFNIGIVGLMLFSWLVFAFAVFANYFWLYHPHIIADWIIWARPVLLVICAISLLCAFVKLVLGTLAILKAFFK